MELATLNVTITETGKTFADAYTSVLRISTTIKALLDDKSKPGVKDGIVSWKTKTKTISSMPYGSKSSKISPRAVTTFVIVFKDFVLLAEWAVMLAAMTGVIVESIDWIVKEDTRAALESKCRMASAANALGKAGDFAQALGFERSRVQPLQLKDSEVKMNARGENGSSGLGMLGDLRGWDVKRPLVFVEELVDFKHSVDAKFVVDIP